MPTPLPRERVPDCTLALVRDPYRFIGPRCAKHGTDAFEARILLRRTVCMSGPAAAELIYDETRFTRAGAMPGRIKKTLLGYGGVQGLDGAEHAHRKAMFVDHLMRPERVARLGELFEGELRRRVDLWVGGGRVPFYAEVREALTRAACAWAGMPLREGQVDDRTRQIGLMFEGAGGVGPKHYRARLARRRGNRWAMRLVSDVRAGKLSPPVDAPLRAVAEFRSLNGERLALAAAGDELLNFVRPIVAVAVFLAQLAHALGAHPDARARVADGSLAHEPFANEVRRLYPFFPFVAAVVRRDFEWNGYAFAKGRRALLDIFATNRDARAWDAPDAFRPERFVGRTVGPFEFVPQGGGDARVTHRCAGELVAVDLMARTSLLLARELAWDVPADVNIPKGATPGTPRGMVLENVRKVG